VSVERDLPDLIRAHLPSVWSLELLLLLRRRREDGWTAQALTDELRASRPIVTSALDRFERSGLVAHDGQGRYRYAPASPLLEEFAEMIERQYRERPVTVINLIVAPEDRIQQLADAFRFRGSDRR
jgi:Mn-dependent DtxR family transcriptional regulator